RGWMRERCWFIPEQVLKGKLPYRVIPRPFMARRIRSCSLWFIYRRHRAHPERATGFAYRLILLGTMFCLARAWNSTGERRRPLGLLLAAPEAWPPPHWWIPRRSIFTAHACSCVSLDSTT